MIAYWLQEVYFATAHLTLCEVYMFEQPGHTNYHPSRKMAAIGKYKLLDSSFFRNSNRFCLLQTRMCANFHISATHKYEQVTVTLFPDVHCVCSTGVQKNVDLHCWQYCVPVVQWFPESRGQCNDDGGIGHVGRGRGDIGRECCYSEKNDYSSIPPNLAQGISGSNGFSLADV